MRLEEQRSGDQSLAIAIDRGREWWMEGASGEYRVGRKRCYDVVMQRLLIKGMSN